MTSAALATTLRTRSGFAFDVRPARPDDEAVLTKFFTHVTQRDLRFRFLTGLRTVGRDQIVAMTHVDHSRTEDFLAFANGELIASAMLACNATLDRGEVAIAIHSGYKGRGVGWELLAYVAGYAEARGITLLEAIESRENHAAIELEREMGFTVSTCPDDSTLVIVRRQLGQALAA